MDLVSLGALVVCDVWQPPGGDLALLQLVHTPEDVVTRPTNNIRKVVFVVILVMVVLDEDEDCIRDVSQVGPLPGADSAHPGPGHVAPGHRCDARQTSQGARMTVCRKRMLYVDLSYLEDLR